MPYLLVLIAFSAVLIVYCPLTAILTVPTILYLYKRDKETETAGDSSDAR